MVPGSQRRFNTKGYAARQDTILTVISCLAFLYESCAVKVSKNERRLFTMSAFLEEYGKVIVVIVVIAALILLAVTFRDKGSEAATNSFTSFTSMAESTASNAASSVNSSGGTTP